MMRALIAGLAVITYSGCATLEKVVTEVEIPIRVVCLRADQVPVVPALTPNAALKALDDFKLVLRIKAERDELAAYANIVDPLLKSCAK